MVPERRLAAVLGMTDEVWARHANPWSVWTRASTLPLLVLAVWSREWIGWWAVLPTTAAILWTWLNPRVFPRPRSTDNWGSKAVLGERVWLNRAEVPVPPRHRRAPHILGAISALGLLALVWGLAALEIWPTVFGVAVVYLAKFWFLDRMVWLYEDMRDADPRYRSWLY